jgi:hypothetical protein
MFTRVQKAAPHASWQPWHGVHGSPRACAHDCPWLHTGQQQTPHATAPSAKQSVSPVAHRPVRAEGGASIIAASKAARRKRFN